MIKPILVVEDDRNDLELTMHALKRCRLANEVISVRDGVEAVEYLTRTGHWSTRPPGNPVVILLDLKLPRCNGLEVLSHIRAHEELRKVPVVMLTASGEPEDLSRSYEMGVNAYVVKPVRFDEFMEAIRELGSFWALLNEPPPGSFKPVPG
jgi:CheY-like chemotaxis protein